MMDISGMFTDDQALSALLSFMRERCDVSSQHKLPTQDEILGEDFAALVGVERTRNLIGLLVSQGHFIAYGPHISDHTIEVL